MFKEHLKTGINYNNPAMSEITCFLLLFAKNKLKRGSNQNKKNTRLKPPQGKRFLAFPRRDLCPKQKLFNGPGNPTEK